MKNPAPAPAGFAIKIRLRPDLEKANPVQPYCTLHKSMETQHVKFFHTYYQALGPELILVYRQSARR